MSTLVLLPPDSLLPTQGNITLEAGFNTTADYARNGVSPPKWVWDTQNEMSSPARLFFESSSGAQDFFVLRPGLHAEQQLAHMPTDWPVQDMEDDDPMYAQEMKYRAEYEKKTQEAASKSNGRTYLSTRSWVARVQDFPAYRKSRFLQRLQDNRRFVSGADSADELELTSALNRVKVVATLPKRDSTLASADPPLSNPLIAGHRIAGHHTTSRLCREHPRPLLSLCRPAC